VARKKNEYLVCPDCSNKDCLSKRREQNGENIYYCSICQNEYFDSEIIRKSYKLSRFINSKGEEKWVHHNVDYRVSKLIKSNALKGMRDKKSKARKKPNLSRRESSLLRRLRKE
tara:strand:+ start:4489 stop:4830 length:342 start_codon:yes stop_codon:yes gene_type:complete